MHWQRQLSPSIAVAMSSALAAQFPVLAPTSNTTIATGGSLHYSSILIPAGVTVQFTGGAPAVVRCDGDCIVHGTLSAAAVGVTDGPGAVISGMGFMGSYCPANCTPFGCFCFGTFVPAGAGVHHGAYGSAIPFSLQGGSPGGATLNRISSSLFTCCDGVLGVTPGGGGGGTLAVIAGGLVDVDGVVDVRGGSSSSSIFPAPGSAGSVLLRGEGGTVLRPSGQVLAGPASAGGEVRLDAWGGLPLVQGIVDAPAPVVLALPHLQATSAPVIGTTWSVDTYAPENSVVFLAAATQLVPGLPTPFGPLEIDLAFGGGVGIAVAGTGHDPIATISWTVPNQPILVGLPIHAQALAWPPALPPRLTNAVSVFVQ